MEPTLLTRDALDDAHAWLEDGAIEKGMTGLCRLLEAERAQRSLKAWQQLPRAWLSSHGRATPHPFG